MLYVYVMKTQWHWLLKLFSLFFDSDFSACMAPFGMSEFIFNHCFFIGLMYKLVFH